MSHYLTTYTGRAPETTIGDKLQWIEGDNSQQTEYQRTRDGIHRVSGFESSIRASLFVDFCKREQVNGMVEFGVGCAVSGNSTFTLAVSMKEMEVDDSDTHTDVEVYGDKLNELEIIFPGECTTIKSVLGAVATCWDFVVEQYTNTLTVIIKAKCVSSNDLDVILDIPLVYGINLVPQGMHILINRRHCSQKGGPIQYGQKRRERIERLASPYRRVVPGRSARINPLTTNKINHSKPNTKNVEMVSLTTQKLRNEQLKQSVQSRRAIIVSANSLTNQGDGVISHQNTDTNPTSPIPSEQSTTTTSPVCQYYQTTQQKSHAPQKNISVLV